MQEMDHELDEDLEDWPPDYNGGAGLASQPETLSWLISQAQAGQRLDVFLAGQFPRLSRSRIQKWISDGAVTLEGRKVKPSSPLQAGFSVEVNIPKAEPEVAWGPEAMDIDVVYEDRDLMVINKPTGLVVHPAAGHPSGTLVNGLLALHPEMDTLARAGIVHRLDRETTGLMVVAKTPEAQLSLVNQLRNRTVSRQYAAVVWGGLTSAQTVDAPIGRDLRDRQRMAVLPQGKGKPAITHLIPVGQGIYRGFAVSLIGCRLETGRTHQIRVHVQHLKHPLIGDPVYHRHAPHVTRLKPLPAGQAEFSRQALHALKLRFIHPSTGKAMQFEVMPPADFLGLLAASGLDVQGLKKIDNAGKK